jgi:hypothetical protein
MLPPDFVVAHDLTRNNEVRLAPGHLSGHVIIMTAFIRIGGASDRSIGRQV